MANKHKIIYPILGSFAVIATGAAIGVPLVIYNQAQDLMGKFVPLTKGKNSLHDKKELNVVALGDSLTAGYNGFYSSSAYSTNSSEYLSYADFLVHNLQKENLVSSYKNFAVSGQRIGDTHNMIAEDPVVIHSLQEADLVTLTVSSNDLLKGVTLLGLPFNPSFDIDKMLGGVLESPSPERDNIFGNNSSNQIGLGPYKTLTQHESNTLFKRAVEQLSQILYGPTDEDGNFNINGGISYQDDLKEIMMDLIKRDLMIMLRDLHEAAPNAKVEVIFPEFPFDGFPRSAIDVYIKKIGESASHLFNRFRAAVQAAADQAQFAELIDTNVAFANYVKNAEDNLSALKPLLSEAENAFKNANLGNKANPSDEELKIVYKYRDLWTQSNHISRIIHDHEWGLTNQESIDRWFMPNVLDIHPSVFGQEVLGNFLYERIRNDIGNISKNQLITQYTAAVLPVTNERPETVNDLYRDKTFKENKYNTHNDAFVEIDALNEKTKGIIPKTKTALLSEAYDKKFGDHNSSIMSSNLFKKIIYSKHKLGDDPLVSLSNIAPELIDIFSNNSPTSPASVPNPSPNVVPTSSEGNGLIDQLINFLVDDSLPDALSGKYDVIYDLINIFNIEFSGKRNQDIYTSNSYNVIDIIVAAASSYLDFSTQIQPYLSKLTKLVQEAFEGPGSLDRMKHQAKVQLLPQFYLDGFEQQTFKDNPVFGLDEILKVVKVNSKPILSK